MSDFVDAKTIAAALGVDKKSVLVRAKKEGWLFEERSALGGQKRVYQLTDLPKIIARKVQSGAAILAMKANREAAKQRMPESFVVVLGDEVYEIRKAQP